MGDAVEKIMHQLSIYLAALLVINPRGELQTSLSWYCGTKAVKPNLVWSGTGGNDTLQLTVCASPYGWRASLRVNGVSHLRASLPLPEELELALMESETLEDRGVSKDHCFTPLCRTKEHLFNLKPRKYWVG